MVGMVPWQRQAMDDLQERSHMLERIELRGFLGNNKNPPWPCSTPDIPAQPSLVQFLLLASPSK